MNKNINTVKLLVQSPKLPQFCKIHEGTEQGVKILFTFLLKMCENIYVIKMMTKMWY